MDVLVEYFYYTYFFIFVFELHVIDTLLYLGLLKIKGHIGNGQQL